MSSIPYWLGRAARLAGFCLLLYAVPAAAQRYHPDISSGVVAADSVVANGLTLVWISKDAGFSPDIRQAMMTTLARVYPAEMKMYNPAAPKRVVYLFDPGYDGVAATWTDKTTGFGYTVVSTGYMRSHPEDVDVATHEAMHLVQAYPTGDASWLIEGIADYVRATMGVNNAKADWSMPPYSAEQRYTNSYRITARFLTWLEAKGHSGIVKKLDVALRNGTYSYSTWKTLTGKTVDELWTAYGANPAL